MKTNDLFISRDQLSQYNKACQKIYPRAHEILAQLFKSIYLLPHQSSINILVPCAGCFPSFIPFLRQLERYPQLTKANIYLIDIAKIPFKLFTEAFKEVKPKTHIQLKFIMENIELSDFLNQNSSSGLKFDLVYIEHPEISAFNIILSYAVPFLDHLNLLRTAIPKLAKFLSCQGKVMIACKTAEEIEQANALLTYGLNAKTKKFSLLRNWVFPVPYSKGIITTHPIEISLQEATHKSKHIELSDRRLIYFFVFGFALWIQSLKGAPFLSSTLSFFIFISLLLFHRPGIKGYAIKILLACVQAEFLANALVDHSRSLGNR